MRQAQIPQLFIMLSAVLVIGATAFLGWRLIGGLTGSSCTINNNQFLGQITQAIDDRTTFGSRDSFSLAAPCEAVALCFVDAKSIGNESFVGNDTTISIAIRSGTKTNIFLQQRKGGTDPVGYDERITLLDPTTGTAHAPIADRCILAVGGKFPVSVEGYGRKIRIVE